MIADKAFEDKKIEFLFSVFAETNEHIRATDEKNVLIAGSFIALVSVVIAILIDKMTKITWAYFAFSLLALVIGYFVVMLQLWYREWKEHYCDVCVNIASKFKLEEDELPYWLRNCEVKSFSIDKVLVIITIIINISMLFCSIYLLWELMSWAATLRTISIIILLGAYPVLIIATKKRLIHRHEIMRA